MFKISVGTTDRLTKSDIKVMDIQYKADIPNKKSTKRRWSITKEIKKISPSYGFKRLNDELEETNITTTTHQDCNTNLVRSSLMNRRRKSLYKKSRSIQVKSILPSDITRSIESEEIELSDVPEEQETNTFFYQLDHQPPLETLINQPKPAAQFEKNQSNYEKINIKEPSTDQYQTRITTPCLHIVEKIESEEHEIDVLPLTPNMIYFECSEHDMKMFEEDLENMLFSKERMDRALELAITRSLRRDQIYTILDHFSISYERKYLLLNGLFEAMLDGPFHLTDLLAKYFDFDYEREQVRLELTKAKLLDLSRSRPVSQSSQDDANSRPIHSAPASFDNNLECDELMFSIDESTKQYISDTSSPPTRRASTSSELFIY